MNGSRFDAITRSMATAPSRRGILGGLLGVGAGLVGLNDVKASCPSGQVSRRGTCLCAETGRPPMDGICPCPKGQTDLGDGLGCQACRANSDCPASDACTAYACVAGECERSKTVCADNDPCSDVACDPTLGCVSTTLPDNDPGACPDGAVCDGGGCTVLGTASDCTAVGNTCSGASPFCDAALGCVACLTPSDCGASDTCTTFTCSAGVCGATVHENASCDDGDLCTDDDHCQADGSCHGVPIVCAAPDQCHKAGACNPTTGRCDYPNKANDTPCDDHNACTQTDTCQDGVCTGSNPVVCTAFDSCHDPGVCDTDTGQCTTPVKTDGVSCSDHNACTQTDTCQNGVCTGANPVECAPPDQCHEAGVCNTSTGACEYQPKPDETACVGEDKCLTVYTCQAGTCTGSEPVVCADPDQCHDAGVCNPATGVCSNPAKADDTACETGDLCTADTCQAGVCTAGATDSACPPLTDPECQSQDACNPTTGSCDVSNRDDGIDCTGGTCCGGGCCLEGQNCCNGKCCDEGIHCCDGKCCKDGETCCNGRCCPSGRCCSGICCNFNNSCCKRDANGRSCYVGSQYCS